MLIQSLSAGHNIVALQVATFGLVAACDADAAVIRAAMIYELLKQWYYESMMQDAFQTILFSPCMSPFSAF